MRRRLSNFHDFASRAAACTAPGSGAGGGDERAPGYLQRAVESRVRREALGQRGLDLVHLSGRAREHGIVEVAREIERRLPQVLEARMVTGKVYRLDLDL